MLREIKRGSPAFERFLSALEQAALPTGDLFDQPFRYFEWEGAAWGGFGAGDDALLRSIVVAPSARGRGYGAAIAQALAEEARSAGTKHLWLLTTGAAPFFERLGWRAAARESAPATVSASRQFTGLCPASATLMTCAL